MSVIDGVNCHGASVSGKKMILIVAALMAFRMLGLFMLLPILPILGQSVVGATPLLLGLALGVYGLTQACMQVPLGILSDRWGRRPLILYGLGVFALGGVVAASSDSIIGIILGRAIQGAGAISSVVLALLSDTTSIQYRAKAMALVGISIGTTFILALILGPVIVNWLDLSGMFWLTVVMALVGMLITILYIPKGQCREQSSLMTISFNQIYRILMDSELRRLDLGIFCLHMSMMAMFVALPALISQTLQIPVTQHWWVYLPVLLGSFVLIFPWLGKVASSMLLKQTFMVAIGALIAAFLLLSVASNRPAVLCLSLLCFFIGFNLLEALLPSTISKAVPPQIKGAALGVYSTAQFLGAFCGGLVGGLIISFSSEVSLFLVAAGWCCAWFVLVLRKGVMQEEKPNTVLQHT